MRGWKLETGNQENRNVIMNDGLQPAVANRNTSGRLAALRNLLGRLNLDALLITAPENMVYTSGFTGEGTLLISRDDACLATDGRYTTQAGQEAPDFRVMLSKTLTAEPLAGVCRERRLVRIGFEKNNVTFQQYEKLQQDFAGFELHPVMGMVESLRLVKDVDEIALIQEAAVVAGAAFHYVLGQFRPGVTEREIASQIDYFVRSRGDGPPAFETIVAAGERGAMPHGCATPVEVRNGQMVVMDFGACWRGYKSDITRTVCVGQADEKQRRIYEIVLEAQLAGLDAVKAGVAAGRVDEAARRVIAGAGYGDYFNHSLGHGVGLQIHEAPRLGPGQELILEPGMITTVEPGIYIPGWGGVRIEDTVLVTEHGCQILTPVTKDFMVL
jgi:Xaa-Pro aminopeptidase